MVQLTWYNIVNYEGDEGRITMEKNSSKKSDIKISLLGLLIGISLIVAGVYGIVSNKIENQEYKNSTDIRTVNAVVEECRRKDEKMMLIS